jgi:hypothetical protein
LHQRFDDDTEFVNPNAPPAVRLMQTADAVWSTAHVTPAQFIEQAKQALWSSVLTQWSSHNITPKARHHQMWASDLALRNRKSKNVRYALIEGAGRRTLLNAYPESPERGTIPPSSVIMTHCVCRFSAFQNLPLGQADRIRRHLQSLSCFVIRVAAADFDFFFPSSFVFFPVHSFLDSIENAAPRCPFRRRRDCDRHHRCPADAVIHVVV